LKAFVTVVLVDERGTRARGVMQKAEYTKGCASARGARARGPPSARGARAVPLAWDTIRVGADTILYSLRGASRGRAVLY
jgi:hypothetical protein